MFHIYIYIYRFHIYIYNILNLDRRLLHRKCHSYVVTYPFMIYIIYYIYNYI